MSYYFTTVLRVVRLNGRFLFCFFVAVVDFLFFFFAFLLFFFFMLPFFPPLRCRTPP